MKPKTFMLIAGEASGDVLGAELVKALRTAVPEAEQSITSDPQPLQAGLTPRFFGAGGPRLAEYGTLGWLGERYRFAYLPSLAALQSQRLHPKALSQWDRDLVSFADPVFGGGDEGAPPEATRAVLASLGRCAR